MSEAEPGSVETLALEISCDAILDGRIRLFQPRKGHRAGTDAVLLAAAAPAEVAGLAYDVGAGVGTAGLILAARSPALRVGLVENDPRIAALARDNLALNGLAERGGVYEADLLSSLSRREAGLAPGMASLVMTNPPFADPDHSRASPYAGKRSAHVMSESGAGALTAWVRACLALLAPGGTFLMIHRAEALPAILVSFGQRLGAVQVLPVQPRKDKPAHRILLRGTKGSRAPFAIAPGLILQDETGFRPLAAAIHRGAALIDW